MSEKWIVAIDQGTSSCRALAVDMHGKISAQQSVTFSPQRPAKGLSQYDAEELLKHQVAVLHQLLDEIGPENAAAIAVCSQRSTVVLWDKQTGQAVAPVLTWEDARSLEQANRAEVSQADIHQQTGLFKAPFFSAPKIAWCLENVPSAALAAKQGTLLVAPVASFLIWHLTKGAVFATDPTLAQRTLLWDLHSRQWSEALCADFGVSPACLPEIRPSSAAYGAYIYKGVMIPITTCVADQQAAAVCHGLMPGDTTVNYGTGAFVLYQAGSAPVVLPGMLSSVAATYNTHEMQFLLEGPIFSAGSLLQWLHASGVCFEMNRMDELCAASTSPVHILPALGGLGAPYWDYQVHAVSENTSPSTTTADWVAGALQAIAARVADILYYLRAQGFDWRNITVSGGLSKSRYLVQTQADWLNYPLNLQLQTESTVLGAAQLAANAIGWNTTGWRALSGPRISPRISAPTSQQRYQAWQQFVRRLRASKSH